jgi:uncharacterized repeat protein (TIGR03803 family)
MQTSKRATSLRILTVTICFGCIIALCGAAAGQSEKVSFTTLVNFDGSNGISPDFETLVQGTDGALYGTTFAGGNNDNGSVFKITTAGTLTTLHLFDGGDGQLPVSGLLLTTSGLLYGTASGGGQSTYYGTIYTITEAGKFTTRYNFCLTGPCPDGSNPYGALVQGINGLFYGTTYQGGTANQGTVFSMTPAGTLTTLHNFLGFPGDGAGPYAALVQGGDGNFYGTTRSGGDGSGTVFKITPDGTFTTLYVFTGGADGGNPSSALVEDNQGNFYGTTQGVGTTNAGTIFKITSSGALTTLYTFCSRPNCSDGAQPTAGLTLATDGNFYGTTDAGGDSTCHAPYGCGTVFKMTPAGALTPLHTFEYSDGWAPFGGLLQATNGTFYGTTASGGNTACDAPQGCGTVFSLSVGLGPFISLTRPAARVGQTIGILGQGLTGSTSVSFNGTAAQFKVVSGTYITATVPTGAISGSVVVTTPGGSLTSNRAFRVLP